MAQQATGLPTGTHPGDDAPPGSPGTGEDICPLCGGSGKLESGRECENCGGSGKVTKAIGGA
ncbi:MAG: hypothetical protein V4731_18235 [Pseudomonadota bacterium]